MTNREKFEDVYGFEPDKRLCVAPQMVCDSQHGNCFKCPFNKFWEKEYRECFKMNYHDRCYRKWFLQYHTV